jgi:hypothetical protein
MTRSVRSLENLTQSASTARILNLMHIWRQSGDPASRLYDPEWAEKPLFANGSLNKSIIVKHRLRRNETEAFGVGGRRLATKVILPIAHTELKYGGQYVFVDQIGFEQVMSQIFSLPPEHPDIATLRMLDKLPSLDPFLLREQLRRNNVSPAPCYFSISPSDLHRMETFVRSEITPLVTMSLGGDMEGVNQNSVRILASKILSETSGSQLDALRETLRLAPHQYHEGVFCWKGFLYYKWSLESLMGDVMKVSEQVQVIKPIGSMDHAAREFFSRSRGVLKADILRTCESVRRTLMIYDEAYTNLKKGRPTDFRDFLLNAPRMFNRLGEELGALQHIVSFWNYRFGPRSPKAGVEELMDIFLEFETGLAGGAVSADAA